MTLVSALATRGTTVLCSLHQPRPEVVRLLDRIVLMSRGRVAFFGAPGEIEDHFMSIGRPLAPLREEPGAREGLDVADAMLDAVGDAEALVDRGSRVAYHSEGATHGAEIEAGNGIGSDGADRALAMRHEILLGQVRGFACSGPLYQCCAALCVARNLKALIWRRIIFKEARPTVCLKYSSPTWVLEHLTKCARFRFSYSLRFHRDSCNNFVGDKAIWMKW